jgi:ferredoxin-2, mitochondrial
MKDMVVINVEDKDGSVKAIEIPADMGLNLMEALKANEYDIEATCGGMALCATCHIRVKTGLEKLQPQRDDELNMLDTLPFVYENSRLSCQIPVAENIDGIEIKIVG